MSIKIALAGVPNCGKTSFWNTVTGNHAETGNRSGVTLKISSSKIKGFDAFLFDLPGAYSLSGEGFEEKVAADFLSLGEADSVIILMDGTKPEQGIYFAFELLSLGIPTVLGINFWDELRAQNTKVDVKGLSKELGVPIFLLSVKEKLNIKDVIAAAVSSAKISHRLQNRIPDEERRRKSAEIAGKYFIKEGASIRLSHFGKFCKNAVLISVPVLMLLLESVLKQILEVLFEHSGAIFYEALQLFGLPQVLIEFLCEGVLLGLESLILFIPELFSVFFMLDFLESCGYLSRFAFGFDFLLKKIGLSGLSVIPLLLGFGCTVPAVYAAKAVDGKTARERTLSALMFVPCGARLPLSLFVCRSVFGEKGIYILFVLYFSVIFFGGAFSYLRNKSTVLSFVTEIPKIRLPQISSVLKTSGYRLKIFISKAGKVLVLTAAVLWVLKNFIIGSQSVLQSIGELISPVLAPVGIPKDGGIALICGFFAKEASLFVLTAKVGAQNIFEPISACSFLIFHLIYSPCFGCLSAIKQEFGTKKAVWLSLRQTALGYFAAFAFYQIATLLQNLLRP